MCKHNSGQELCYLCHQRQRRNVPISFTEEKEKAEQELDKALQQYQMYKDEQFYDQERVCAILKYPISFDRILCAYYFELTMAMLSFTYFHVFSRIFRDTCHEKGRCVKKLQSQTWF